MKYNDFPLKISIHVLMYIMCKFHILWQGSFVPDVSDNGQSEDEYVAEYEESPSLENPSVDEVANSECWSTVTVTNNY